MVPRPPNANALRDGVGRIAPSLAAPLGRGLPLNAMVMAPVVPPRKDLPVLVKRVGWEKLVSRELVH